MNINYLTLIKIIANIIYKNKRILIMAKESPFKSYNSFLKRKMFMSRILGIFSCMLAIASIVMLYFNAVSEWMCIIIIGYAMATVFSSNSFLQGIKIGNPWQRINMVCAIFFYIAVIGLIVYGFITGELTTQF